MHFSVFIIVLWNSKTLYTTTVLIIQLNTFVKKHYDEMVVIIVAYFLHYYPYLFHMLPNVPTVEELS